MSTATDTVWGGFIWKLFDALVYIAAYKLHNAYGLRAQLNFFSQKMIPLHSKSTRWKKKCVKIYRWICNCSFRKTTDGFQFETDCWTNIGYFLKLLPFFFSSVSLSPHLQCDIDWKHCELWSRKKIERQLQTSHKIQNSKE